MVGRGAKGGEGMGRAAAADVLGGWEGMVPASPNHTPPRAPFKMLIPTPGSRRRGSAQTRASRRTRSGTVADSEEERSALPTAGTWPAIEAGHRDSLLYSGGKNPRDSAATQASAHHHTHHIEADGTHTSHKHKHKQARHSRTAHAHSITHHAVLAETAGWITGPPIRRRAPLAFMAAGCWAKES